VTNVAGVAILCTAVTARGDSPYLFIGKHFETRRRAGQLVPFCLDASECAFFCMQSPSYSAASCCVGGQRVEAVAVVVTTSSYQRCMFTFGWDYQERS